MKKAPIKILIILLITGIICVFGEIVLSEQLDEMHVIHQGIMDKSVKNREYMAEISKQLYEHQALLVNYALSDSKEMQELYAVQETELRESLTELIIEFSYRMKVGECEQIYHRVYSDFSGYEENTSLFLSFIENGERDMAIYYNDNVLENYLDDIKLKFEDLERLTTEDIETAEAQMDEAVRASEILRVAVIVIVIVFLVLCIFICVKITTDLDAYKEQLEVELIEKNRALQQHNERMLKLQDGIIYSMANLIESRDGETGEHVKRTSAYVEMIARAAKEQGVYVSELTDDFIERLTKVAPLHDVGKIAVPDHILMKPGRLTAEEFEEIKKHAPRGKAMIEEFFAEIEDKEYVGMASAVAGYHHEKWSGEGYAEGLSGEEIPLAARIMALADVFDALVSKRCYKDAFSLDEAFGIIEESAGTHFDPKLAAVFLSLRGQIEEYLKAE